MKVLGSIAIFLTTAQAQYPANATHGWFNTSVKTTDSPDMLGACNIKSSTTIVLYDGVGTGTFSSRWENEFWTWWAGADPAVEWVTVSGPQLNTGSGCKLSDYPNVKLYVQPGGDAYQMQDSIRTGGRGNIVDYLSGGGSYLGTCAGWFLAAEKYVWQGSSYQWPNVLGIFEGQVEGSITDIADYEGDPNYAATPIQLQEGGSLTSIYYGGPTMGWKSTPATLPSGWKAVAKFAANGAPHGTPAAVQKGNMLLTSPHFEAHEAHGLVGFSTKDRLANYIWRAQQINALLGTSWAIPTAP